MYEAEMQHFRKTYLPPLNKQFIEYAANCQIKYCLELKASHEF